MQCGCCLDVKTSFRRTQVTINVPLTKQTKGMIDADNIGKMKRGAYLVNNARGGIVDQGAVVEALESGQLAGYAGDSH